MRQGFWLRLLKEEEGQALTEYVLLLSASVGVAVALARGLVQAIDKGILFLGGQLEKDLKTGRADPGVWRN
jgi:hypothetical protein